MSDKEQRKAPVLRFKGFTDDWEQRKLKDTANFAKGIGYSKKDLKSSGIPIILYGRLYTKYETVINEIDTFTQPKKDTFLSKGGEIIVPASGETAEDISVASVVKNKGIILGGDLNIVYPNSSLNSVFLALNITYGRAHDEMRRRAQGKTIVHLHNSDLANIKLKIPTISEQKKIVYLLEKINKLIALQQRKLDELTNLKKAYLYRLFPDEKQNIPILRFSNITNEWKKYKLGEISKRITRKNLDLESRLPLTISAQYGLIKQKDFFNKQVASKNPRNYILLKSGEFAYNKSYSRDSPYGAIKRLNSYPQGVISSLYIAFKPVDVDSNFLEQYYNSQRWYKEIYKVATEGARNHGLLNISPQDFFNTNLYIPVTKSEQLKIGALLNTLDRLITHQQKRITSYQRIKKFLLQNMFI